MVSVRISAILKKKTLTQTLRSKNYSSSKFQPDAPSVRDIQPPRGKRCDGKLISLRQGWR